MRDFRKLDIWKQSMDIAVETYQLTRGFPKEERYELVSQMKIFKTCFLKPIFAKNELIA